MLISSSTTFRSSERSDAERRTEDQVRDHVRGLRQMLVQHAGLIRRVLAGRVGVERPA
jgi:hypothetical protein